MTNSMNHERFFTSAADEAKKATCYRAHCGSVIVATDGSIIGAGYNSPPLDDESQRTCDVTNWDFDKKPKYDKTCCIHAEWNAILDACKHHANEIEGSTLYFMRIGEDGAFTDAGEPYCTVCSRLALQSGIAIFALWNDGPQLYDTKTYNALSYQYHRGV